MRINDFDSGSKINPYHKDNKLAQDESKAKTSEGEKTSVESGYKVQLSTRAKEIARAGELVKNAPATREEKVATIKAQVEAGEYKVDSVKIADKMLRDAIEENI